VLSILIVDDDEEVRRKAMRALAGSQVRLASAADGAMGLEQAALLQPDIVICDVDLPGRSGFDVLSAIKADPRLASAQVMMLTSHVSRNSMRLGMSLGADDYLTKPFTDEELVEAVEGLVRRLGRLEVIRDAARGEEQTLREKFAADSGGGPEYRDSHAAQITYAGPEPTEGHETFADAAVLFADIRSFTSIAEKLPSQDVARLLAEYFDRACEPVLKHGGRYIKLLGDGLMAVFVQDPTRSANPSQRALLAAIDVTRVGVGVATWATTTFPHALLPPFRVGVGLHCGEVVVSQMSAGPQKAPTPVGDTVNVAARLEQATKELGWSIVASAAVMERAGGIARAGRSQELTVRNLEAPVQVHEVLVDDQAQPERTLVEDATLRMDQPTADLREAARRHAGLAAGAVKQALGDQLDLLRRSEDGNDGRGLRLQGFRILRRLATGGMATIHLAVSEATGELVVLKVLPVDSANSELTARFMREFALLSQLSHPNVVRIYNQGFGDKLAYIAMEYFENGDLRSRMAKPLEPREATAIGIQVASALAAAHAMDIVHRDLKPENLMVRADGQVVLADFGIAKVAGGTSATDPTLTRTGELLGSPSYMSPEQVTGQRLTHRVDLYSLGVVLYELCTGKRPYDGATVMELLVQHVKAPPPTLPPHAAMLQPVLDRLMAKKPADRYADAGQAEAALRQLASQI
jgi:class 3 adenylate cyclase/FixJ family two-component response regulator